MDAISYSYADKQAKRIKKFINEPDSTSGIVTVPKVIASTETITIPAGRVAILPNVQIDGVLNIENDGEVFIPSGATLGDLDAQLALKAPLVNPAFTNPTATTQAAQDNSTKVATTAYVDGKMVLGTAVNATGTAVDFTGIPSWAKKITVMFNGVSTNGTSVPIVRLGSGSVQTSGYLGTTLTTQGVGIQGSSQWTSSIPLSNVSSNTMVRGGTLSILNIIGNAYALSGCIGNSEITRNDSIGGSITLSGILDRIRITTVNGTDTFDAGQINIMYEG